LEIPKNKFLEMTARAKKEGRRWNFARKSCIFVWTQEARSKVLQQRQKDRDHCWFGAQQQSAEDR
jgi:hypothetical protein